MKEDEFSAFEHRGWERVAQPYHAYFGALTIQSHAALLDALGVRRGVRFLDVASGPGYLAAAAAQRSADVVGVDFADSMVDQARRIYPSLTFRIGSAEDLPFADDGFDAVGISFGMLHFSHPEKALEEAFRVLQPGGKVGFTVWAAPEKAVGFSIVLKAIEAHGRMDVQLPPGPPFFRFSDWAECERVLLAAGFREPRVQEVEQTLHAPSPDALFEMLMRGGVRVSAILNAQTPQALAAIAKAVHDGAARYRSGDGSGEVSIPMPCVLASATKP
ncbi:class I SAM-dependent methyltransferase [Paraburkholderia sp. Tr-20389]|uniref:class I SAM-dependent methyltransferase n=1 Tax=Paraburkholderia sp. Tr-20389 TaxID=2703903 RepID=UPI00197D33EE|nr:class I SAM-dependent methyltransferase [Paraburkholderia sp. Tr-20389]MBN3758435.1 class I SAM-dependent methyltransferase [Paraburkholderia sp. Tr-20389]